MIHRIDRWLSSFAGRWVAGRASSGSRRSFASSMPSRISSSPAASNLAISTCVPRWITARPRCGCAAHEPPQFASRGSHVHPVLDPAIALGDNA